MITSSYPMNQDLGLKISRDDQRAMVSPDDRMIEISFSG